MQCNEMLIKFFTNLKVFGILSVTQTYSIITACSLAAIGLIYDDYSVLLGAMLASPITGPVRYSALAIDQGKAHYIPTAIKMLLTMGTFALIVGFLMTMLIENNFKETFNLPTPMMNKGSDSLFFVINIILGCISGLITPYAIKENQVMLMIGMYICVSTLPPIVNCGMFLGLAYLRRDDEELRKQYLDDAKKSIAVTGTNMLGMFISSIVGFRIACMK